MGADYTVAEIVVYPVKACKGVPVTSAAISSTGWKRALHCIVMELNTRMIYSYFCFFFMPAK